MSIKERIAENIENTINIFNSIGTIGIISATIEILIIAFCIYKILEWINKTRAWSLLKGILVLVIFFIIAWLFDFNVIFYIFKQAAPIATLGIIIVFQNDIRAGLEYLGRQNFISKIFPNYKKMKLKTNENVAREIVDACFSMAKTKTGALIVIEQKENLKEIEETGIMIDGKVSRALLINIFEKNTPLHDGAVLIVGDTIKAATCYLPLSNDNTISKSLGTRHRAALGISEISDSQTIVVSEETGRVSFCQNAKISLIKDEKDLLNKLLIQD